MRRRELVATIREESERLASHIENVLEPRPGAPTLSDNHESTLALSQFTLMIFGLALIVKGVI